MSSTTVSVPKYRHHKASGQAFVQIKGVLVQREMETSVGGLGSFRC